MPSKICRGKVRTKDDLWNEHLYHMVCDCSQEICKHKVSRTKVCEGGVMFARNTSTGKRNSIWQSIA